MCLNFMEGMVKDENSLHVFAARRYWADEEKLRSAYETLALKWGKV